MGTQGNIHFFTNWAKERLDEMDATLTSLQGKAAEVQADARDRAGKVLAELARNRDAFRETVKQQAGAGEAAWASAKTRMEADWIAFEAEVQKYVENYGEQFELRQATFKQQAEAQVKSWREAADKLAAAAGEFAAERRGEIEANVKRMQSDAAAAEEKLRKLNEAGSQSWSALTAALTETRNVFDRANQAAQEAFKRAVS